MKKGLGSPGIKAAAKKIFVAFLQYFWFYVEHWQWYVYFLHLEVYMKTLPSCFFENGLIP